MAAVEKALNQRVVGVDAAPGLDGALVAFSGNTGKLLKPATSVPVSLVNGLPPGRIAVTDAQGSLGVSAVTPAQLDALLAQQGGGGSGGYSLGEPIFVERTDSITTTSTSPVVATGMTYTPAAGKYLVLFSGSVRNTNNSTFMRMSIYLGGSQLVASERRASGGSDANRHDSFTCLGLLTASGAQAVEGRWKVESSDGTGNMYARQLVLLPVLS